MAYIIEKLLTLEERVAYIEQRVAKTEEGVAEITIEERVAKIEERLTKLEERVAKIEESKNQADISDNDGDTPLLVAITSGSKGDIDILMKQEPNILKRYGYDALDRARTAGNAEIVAMVEEKYKEIPEVFAVIEEYNKAYNKHDHVYDLIFANKRDDVEILFHMKRTEVIEMRSISGESLLKQAAYLNHHDIVSFLLQGIDVLSKDNFGRTALDAAKYMNYNPISVQIILNHLTENALDDTGKLAKYTYEECRNMSHEERTALYKS